MNYSTELRVSEEDANYFGKLCQSPNAELVGNAVLFDEEVKFKNGMVGCIQVISGENPENESCWSQFILYEPVKDKARGTTFLGEVTCSEVKETFLGEYKLSYGEDEYTISVLIEDWVEA